MAGDDAAQVAGTSGEVAAPQYTVSDAEGRQIADEAMEEARRLEEELVAALPQERQDAIREIQKQLASNGQDVRATKDWWGFAVHLSAKAAQDVADIAEMIGDVAGELLGGKIGKLVEAACKARALLIRAVGKDYGCRLVSPWVAPAMLFPIPAAPADDTHLWWTVLGTDSNDWSPDEKFTAHRSKSNPALAVHNGKLYCVHRGDGDNKLWWTVYDPDTDTGWSPDTAFPGHLSSAGPALAAFNGHLYCVHKGNNDNNLWWTRFNGTSWSTDTQMAGRTDRGPALAVHGGKLYCVYKGAGDNTLWWRTFNGTSWSGEDQLGGRTNSNPALAVYNNNLYAVYKGHNTNRLYMTRFNGSGWDGDNALPGHTSAEGPALAAFNGHLYCLHRGGSDGKLWWARYNGSTWSTDTSLPGHYSAQGPAISVFRDKNGTKDQLMCVHRGS
ncbi:hypothetical protein [Streptomyces sp. A1136]|uniref:hypothetical protein n=1 Tax=Streptomyces sp. A1136 TaxID=2563102 RepID=UPI00109E739A|nr:hypothetical protein [Streptomyces sp. A1136]THA45666.1 hypothetical protein E6R62_35245 [Streptomyces sp. A1136]